MTDKSGVHDRVAVAKVGVGVKISLLMGAILLVGYTVGRRGPTAAAAAPSASSNNAGRAGAPATVALTPAHTFTASRTDSLHATMFDSSTAALAAGATLTLKPEVINARGTRWWAATLAGSGRFTLAASNAVLAIHGPTGEVRMTRGTYDVNVSPTLLLVHTIAGENAVLYKPHGLFAWIPRQVPADDVGRAEDGRSLRVSKR